MKVYFGGALCVLLHIGACLASIGPSIITADEDLIEILENKLSELDLDREIENAEQNSLCRNEGSMEAINPDIDEDSKLHVVGTNKNYVIFDEFN